MNGKGDEKDEMSFRSLKVLRKIKLYTVDKLEEYGLPHRVVNALREFELGELGIRYEYRYLTLGEMISVGSRGLFRRKRFGKKSYEDFLKAFCKLLSEKGIHNIFFEDILTD